MEDHMEVNILTLKIDLDNTRKACVEFNKDLFDALGTTFGQVVEKFGADKLNDFIIDFYKAIGDCVNEVKNDDK